MEQKKVVLCDTDVMIEFYRGNQEIITELKNIGQEYIAISYITAGELIFGAFNKRDLTKLKKDIEHIALFDIDNKICEIFIDLLIKYTLSHHLAVPDGFIAATAIANDVELFTLNKKDFKFITGLKLHQY